jgi:cyclophilin family peptidyl-prolyl cis-trans isomerase
MVRFETSLGDFTLELDADKAPISAANFLAYVDEGFFDGLIFHRVIPGFMVQGGGFTPDMNQKKNSKAQIKNEAANGLKNKRGTIAMARTNVVDSATCQFFINLVDNGFLDHQGPGNYGYAVFGQVVDGLDTIDRIAKERTGRSKGHDDVPVTPVVIKSAKRVEAAS